MHLLRRLEPILPALLALGLYWNTLGHGFVYDDFAEVVDNPLVRDFRVEKFVRAYFHRPGQAAPAGRPFPVLTYAATFALAGNRPAVHHLINLLLHAAIALLIYRAGLLLFPGERSLAGLTALLFAGHPILADTVNPIAGRSELISSFSFLLVLTIYLKQTPEPRSPRGPWFWLTLPVFCLGALSKETSWSLPLVLAGCDFFRFRPPDGEKIFFRSRGIWLYRLRVFYLPYLLPPALIFAVLLWAGYLPAEAEGSANFLRHLAPLPRIAAALGILARYLVLLFVPLRLSCDYGYRQLSCQPGLIRAAWTLGGLLAAAGAALLARTSLRRRGRYFFALGLFAAPYLIVSNLLVLINTPMAERLLYLPAWGFCLFLALALTDLARRGGGWLTVVRVLGAGLLLFYGVRTWTRNRDWKDQKTLMEAAWRVCPQSGRVHYNLGLELEERGELKRAHDHYLSAAEILPLNPVFRLSLGNVEVKLGRREEAAASFREAIRLNPGDPRGYRNLGRVSLELNRPEEAAAAYRRAADLAGDDPAIQNSLAIALYRSGDEAGAIRAFRRALEIDPGFADARENLRLLAETKR